MDNYKHLKYRHILNDCLFFTATNILPTISIHSGQVRTHLYTNLASKFPCMFTNRSTKLWGNEDR